MSWDIALSEIEFGDYSACVVLLIRKEIVYILEVVRGRFPFETRKKKVMELKRRYDASTLLIEDSPFSLGLIQSLRAISPTPTSALDRLPRPICSPEDRSVFPGAPDGWKNSSLSCSLFSVATMIRSMLSPKASPGFANSEAAR
jgi:hypothetical protein